MIELFWRVLALILSSPAVAHWLIVRAERTPYTPIMSADGTDLYMGRWWLFNPYPHGSDGTGRRWGDWLPSVRVHWIRREDRDRHMHDHPWNARTIILRGYYVEQREGEHLRVRLAGDTARLLFGEYHRILSVCEDGAWTLFITWRKRGTWGFLVDGQKVPWREYLAQQERS